MRGCRVPVILPRPLTSGAKAEGRFDKQDFSYMPYEDVCCRAAGQLLTYLFTAVENGMALRRYWSTAA